MRKSTALKIFQSTPPSLAETPGGADNMIIAEGFQSTPPSLAETLFAFILCVMIIFQSTPPSLADTSGSCTDTMSFTISIHSAIASADRSVVTFSLSLHVALPSAIASGDPKGRIILAKLFISIHSAIASGDWRKSAVAYGLDYFNPLRHR